MAVISSLEIMENIVANSPDLEWDGWDVVSYGKAKAGFINPKAVRKDGKWRIATRFTIESDGWTVPDRLLRYVAG